MVRATEPVDNTKPTINVSGFTKDTIDMPTQGEGYALNIDNNPTTEYNIQFKSGTVASEELPSEYFGLYLKNTSTVSAAELKTYYANNTSGEFLTYLNGAAEGTNPFVYIKGNGTTSVQLIDGARHQAFAGSQDLDMVIPGDAPLGTYILEGKIIDLAGNETTVVYTLNIKETPTSSGGDPLPEDTTKPDLVSVSATIGNLGQTIPKGTSITTSIGSTVGSLSAILTENSTLISGDEGEITITGPLLGGPETTAPYGTFTINGTNVVITPYPGNDVLAHVGTFTFKVAAGTLKDAASNTNDEISFILIVYDINIPVITLLGTSPIDIIYGYTYTDAGAIAYDNMDKDITEKIVTNNPVNISTPGQYTVTYNVSDKAYNDAIEVIRIVNVIKAPSTTTITCPESMTYTGSPITPCSVTVVGEGGLSLTPIPSYTSNTNVGTVTATYTFEGDSNHNESTNSKTFEIAKAQQAALTTRPQTITYPELFENLTTTGGSGEGLVTYTVTTEGTAKCSISESNLNYTNAGTCTVTATKAGDANYLEVSSAPQTFTINKVDAVINISGYNNIYDGSAHGATGTAVGIESTPADLNSLLHLGDSFTNTPGGIANWTFDGNDNYNSNSGNTNITITSSTSTTTITCPESMTYTGLAIEPCTVIVTAIGATNPSVTISYSQNINVGTATATASYSDGNNSQSSDTKTFDITVDTKVASTIIETKPNIDGTESGTIPTETSFLMDTPIGNVGIEMPADITITGPAEWDGKISAPMIITEINLPAITGETKTLTSAIEVGFSGVKLTFNKAVKISMPGQVGKRVGYTRGEEPFIEITNICTENTQTWADANIIEGSECKTDVGSDLIIWTKHFTKFATYTQTVNPKSSSGGGWTYIAPITKNIDTGCLPGQAFNMTTGKACSKAIISSNNQFNGEVLGAEKYNFTKLMKKGSKGNEVMELQKFLSLAGYECGTADGKFGNITKNAVIKYQLANKLKGDGSVGALTRAVLNK